MAELQQLIDSGNLDQLDNMVSEFAREFVGEQDGSQLTTNNNNNKNANSLSAESLGQSLKKESNNNPAKLVH